MRGRFAFVIRTSNRKSNSPAASVISAVASSISNARRPGGFVRCYGNRMEPRGLRRDRPGAAKWRIKLNAPTAARCHLTKARIRKRLSGKDWADFSAAAQAYAGCHICEVGSQVRFAGSAARRDADAALCDQVGAYQGNGLAKRFRLISLAPRVLFRPMAAAPMEWRRKRKSARRAPP